MFGFEIVSFFLIIILSLICLVTWRNKKDYRKELNSSKLNQYFFHFKKIESPFIITFDDEVIQVIELFGKNLENLETKKKTAILNVFANFFRNIENKMEFTKLEFFLDLSSQKTNLQKSIILWEKELTFETTKGKNSPSVKRCQAAIKKLKQEISFLETLECNTELKVNRYFLLIIGRSKQQLKENYKFVNQLLNQVDLRPTLANEKTIYQLLEKIYVPDSQEMRFKFKDYLRWKQKLWEEQHVDVDLAQFFFPYKLYFRSRYVKVVQSQRTITPRYERLISLASYPVAVEAEWLAVVANFKNTNFFLQVENLSVRQAKIVLEKALINVQAKLVDNDRILEIVDLKQQVLTLKHLLEQVTADKEKLKLVFVCFFVYGETKNDVDHMTKKLTEKLIQLNFLPNFNYFQQRVAFQYCLPKLKTKLTLQKHEISSNSLALSWPFTFFHLEDKDGFHFGGVENSGFVFFDIFQQDIYRTNSNMFIIGTSGQGKSYTLKKITNALFLRRTRVFILDPEREYRELAFYYGGNWVDVGSGSGQVINPLQVFGSTDENLSSIANHFQLLESFFSIVVPELSTKQLIFIIDILKKFYVKKKIYEGNIPQDASCFPTFTDFFKFLKQEVTAQQKATQIQNEITEMKDILIYFQRFVDGSLETQLWNGVTNLETNNLLNVYDLYTLTASGNIRIINAQTFLFLKFLENEVRINKDLNLQNETTNKIVIVIDEAHLIIDKNNPVALNFIHQMVKRIRKYFGSIIITTQNVNDFVGDETIKKYSTAIINNCQYSMVFKLNPGDISDLNSLLRANKLSPSEQIKISLLERGKCFFSLTAKDRFFFSVFVNDFEREVFEKTNNLDGQKVNSKLSTRKAVNTPVKIKVRS